MDRIRYLVSAFCLLGLILMVCSCGGSITDDEVAAVKQLLATFERGVDQKSEAVLDSGVLDKKANISAQLLSELLREGEYQAARIASKSFVMVADSAEVRLILSLQYGSDQEEPTQLEKPIRLYLGKKSGQWRIKSFIAAPDEGVPEEQKTP
jgi:hypothetical protein